MKHTLLFLLLFFFSLTVLAQSDNVCPESSVPTVPINSCAPTSYSVAAGFGVDPFVPTGTTCVTASNVKRDGWFQFTATSTTTTIIGTANAGQDLALVVYSGTCGNMTEENCINGGGNAITETLPLTTVVGTTYYIRVVKNASTSGTLSGTISVLSPPTNDDCSGATSLTVHGATCGGAITGSIIGATQSVAPISWFEFGWRLVVLPDWG